MSAPKPLSFLLISDVHFGPLASSADFALRDNPPKHEIKGAAPMKASLIRALSNTQLSAILASGDLTSAGRPAEFKECASVILQVGADLGIQGKNVFLAFGNHDVDWRVSSLAAEDGKPKDPLYADLAAHVGPIFIQNPPPSEKGPLPGAAIYERDDFFLFVLNSGYYCAHDQTYRHGVLKTQLAWLEQALASTGNDRWRILLLHHHPQNYPYPTVTKDISSIEEGAELMELIGKNNLDLVCHGHRHHPYLLTMMRNGWRAPVTFLCAGSLAVNDVERRQGEIPNLCHVVHLNERGPEGGARGQVITYRYTTSMGWFPGDYSREVPLDGRHRFGSIATENDRNSAAHEVIRAAASGTTDFEELPLFKLLPFSLQCMPISDLNALIRDVSFRAFSRKVVGLYPESPVLLRKVNNARLES